eukprot:CAMPEP_0169422424 /NCGR_PEP_ID=MMETSP1017-20121227/66925_1 /TAXON_ID=342587 /ORGANISM="Karlodinium micrum, Strain CCMP2283" /LENGTH=92 /DNA_ID=CAMNT_0009531991 /DNA_START=21 /DNA_END=296 /DNA_ORIENTATION=-
MGIVQHDLEEVMGMMRGNISAMTDREMRLNELSNKSSTLQGTADAFSRQSKALQWEMKWQRIRVWLLVAVLVVWGLAFFFVPVSKLVFFLIS